MDDRATSAAETFPVVALGGSAGGLEAFNAFLDAVAAQEEAPGMAFIVIPHLSPSDESHMPELLGRRTRLPTEEVTDATVIAPDRIYVLRPNEMLRVEGGRLVPHARAAGRAHHPVDDLFHSLGESLGRRAVAVVLSGTGRDGSAGLATVNEHGGLVLAQDPATAEFGDMPGHAIDTGLVDAVLAPGEMIALLSRAAPCLARQVPEEATAESGPEAAAGADSAAEPDPDAYGTILETARTRTAIDFAQYKTGTLQRRIERRVFITQCASWSDYAALLARDEAEQAALGQDLMITVTGFFRDGDAWERLREAVIRPVVAEAAADEPLRVWAAGCGSGEEAYTLAILLFEEAGAQGKRIAPEIFATDAAENALARAREGLYSAAAVQHLSHERRARFFDAEDDSVRLKPWLRQCLVFAPHNLMADPPFSRMHLVVCRNVLIYLKPEVQSRLLRLFHFALREGGYLFLGSAETLGDAEEMFDTVDKKWRLFRRRGPTRHDIVDFPVGERASPRPAAPEPGPAPARDRIAETALRALAARHAPPAVLVNDRYEVLYYQGATETVLGPQSGKPSNDLLALAPTELASRLRRLVETVAATGESESAQARLTRDDGGGQLRIDVAPVRDRDGQTLFLVSFLAQAPEADPSDSAAPPSSREAELEGELRLLREEFGTAAQSAARSEEDQKAYNEEIVSMNEELRASNEELETSKEELQSLNEEFNTVNAQLRGKVDELQQRTGDLDNLLANTGIATLFLDADLNIRWFSPGMKELFGIRSSDIHRPINDFVQRFEDASFQEDCQAALRDLAAREAHVATDDDLWLLRRVAPYRATDDRIEGVCVTFTDVTAIERARQYAELIVETTPTPFLVLDREFRLVSANAAFHETFDLAPAETGNRLIYHLDNGSWDFSALRHFLDEVLPQNVIAQGHEIEHEFGAVGHKTLLLSARGLNDHDLILLAIEDITERKAGERQSQMLMAELSHRMKNALSVVQSLASQTAHRSADLGEFRRVFEGRLAAFARGHDELMRRNWEASDLRALVRACIESHAVDPDRVSFEGRDLEIPPKPALALSLALHELETNASKYGALSGEAGTVEIAWSLEPGDWVRLVWRERGGPPVTPPETTGFGTMLVTRLFEHESAGQAEVTYEREGVRCVIGFPRGDGSR